MCLSQRRLANLIVTTFLLRIVGGHLLWGLDPALGSFSKSKFRSSLWESMPPNIGQVRAQKDGTLIVDSS